MRHEPWETAPLAQEPVERTTLGPIPGFEVDRVRFRSQATGDLRFFLALVPTEYSPHEEVLMLLHGWGDRPEDLLTRLGMPETYSKLLATGEARPAIVVLPDVRFDMRDRREDEGRPFPRYLDLIGDEVRGIVSRLYSIPQDRQRWHIGGFSFGGFVSLDVARHYGSRFGSVAVISAFGDPQWTYWPEKERASGDLVDEGREATEHDAFDPIPRILLACGTEDRFYPKMLDLHRRFLALGVAHTFLATPGGHNFSYWKSALTPVLLFHLRTDRPAGWTPGVPQAHRGRTRKGE